MRIAYFTNTYPRATDTFIRREVIGLRKRGLDVLTYSVHLPGNDHEVDEEVIVEKSSTKYILPANGATLFVYNLQLLLVHPLRYFKAIILAIKSSRPGLKGSVRQFYYFLEAIILSRLLVNDRVEHLHNHLGDSSGTVTLLASKLSGIPYSISIHGPHIFFDGTNWALDIKTRNSKFISCIGHYCSSQMMLYSKKEDWSKVKIIRCGIDPDVISYRQPVRKAKKLVYVGRLSVEKGIPVLFESLLKLINKEYEVELVLLGDGEDRGYLEKTARDIGIDKYVDFRGFVDQCTVVNTLMESDIFVLPSFAEGIPVALMEAMAIGIPVIATYVGGVTELVLDQKTGQVTYPSDSDGLAKAIAKYIDDPAFCKEISINARKKVSSEFDVRGQIDKLATLFLSDERE